MRNMIRFLALIPLILLCPLFVQAGSLPTISPRVTQETSPLNQDSSPLVVVPDERKGQDHFRSLLDFVTGASEDPSKSLNVSALNGLYVFSSAGGTAIGSAVSLESRIGAFRFDGFGGFSMSRIVHSTSFGSDTRQFTGRYVVDDPNLGAITLTMNTGARLRAFLTDGGDGFVFADIDSFGSASAGFARRVQ